MSAAWLPARVNGESNLKLFPDQTARLEFVEATSSKACRLELKVSNMRRPADRAQAPRPRLGTSISDVPKAFRQRSDSGCTVSKCWRNLAGAMELLGNSLLHSVQRVRAESRLLTTNASNSEAAFIKRTARSQVYARRAESKRSIRERSICTVEPRVARWDAGFTRGRTSTKDDPRSTRSTTAVNEEWKGKRKNVLANRRVMARFIAE
ncbi:hypothetical protein EVAR_49261_1 [Eumeta japonica]|uniref:Uncharacterized protein n=1 Tax=Eumeta variegata TaxID=151549 RepID=A0A4C1YJ67_EUMVA|nr:hypothetical protein EVAR_49261_1 [Eumeta japonica]